MISQYPLCDHTVLGKQINLSLESDMDQWSVGTKLTNPIHVEKEKS
jgi:hypothetical protein